MTVTSKGWERAAKALDMRLGGAKLEEIGRALGVSRERARQLTKKAGRQLMHRVFHGVSPRGRYGGTGAYGGGKAYWYVDRWIIL